VKGEYIEKTHKQKYVIALYIRLSLEDVKSNSMSINSQRLILKKYAEMLEHECKEIEILEFVDNGHSGTNFERPAVQELLDLVRQNKIDCIIVKDFTRFGRNSIETGYFMEKVFPLFHTRFIAIEDSFDSDEHAGDMGGLEVAFKHFISEYYSVDLSKKSRSAKYSKMKRGEYQSKICCYGYKKGKEHLEIDDTAAKVVKMIFHMAFNGMRNTQIAKILNQRKIPTPGQYKNQQNCGRYDLSRSFGLWSLSTIAQMITDERYTGMYIMGKRTVLEIGSKRSKLKNEIEWYKIPNHHPAIIDKDIFEKVQSVRKTFKSVKKAEKVYPLKGKAICGCCQHSLSYQKRKISYFHCRHTSVDETFSCHGLKIEENELHSILFDIISKQAQIILNINSITSGNMKKPNLQLDEKISYEKQISRYENEKRLLYEKYFLGEITEDSYRKSKSECSFKIRELQSQYVALSSEIAKMQMDEDKKKEILEIAQNVAKENTLNQTLAELLIKKVLVYPDEQIVIEWKVDGFI